MFKQDPFIHPHRIASDNLGVFPPGIIGLLGVICSFHFCKNEVELIKGILTILELASFGCGSDSDSSWNMDKSYTGFYLINILTTIATTVEPFKADIVVFADLRNLWNDADIYVPVLSFVMRTKWTLADPLNRSL